MRNLKKIIKYFLHRLEHEIHTKIVREILEHRYMKKPKKIIKYLLYELGYEIHRTGGGYLNAKKTIKKAKQLGMTVCEYVESLWNAKGSTDAIIQQLKEAGAIKPCKEVCEVGPGTGRFLERVLRECKPTRYHIYETDPDWASWLAKTYAPVVIKQPADGRSLCKTADNSCDLVHAHGVFVYIPFLNSFEYFKEMIRVCAIGGYIAFDIFSDEEWNFEVINKWIATPNRYPVILPEHMVVEFFENQGCKRVYRFNVEDRTYLVFKKSRDKKMCLM